MADSTSSPSSPALSDLRQLGQSHLTEIDKLNSTDAAADARRRSDWHDEWAHRATLTKAKSKPQKRITRHLGPERPQKSQPSQKSASNSSSDEATTIDPTNPTAHEANALAYKGKLRPATDVLHRLMHDPSYTPHLQLYRVGYLDRLEGIRTVSVQEWLDRSQDQDSDEWVPTHRIRWFKKIPEGKYLEATEDDGEHGEIVWHRFNKIDLIFGSGDGKGRDQVRP